MYLIILILVISLVFFLLAFLPLKSRWKKRLISVSAAFYLLFIGLAVEVYLSRDEVPALEIATTNPTLLSSNPDPQEKKAVSFPLAVEWQKPQFLTRGKAFKLILQVEKQTEESQNIKLQFNQALAEVFAVIAVNPAVNFIGDVVNLGQFKGKQTLQYTFELAPKTSGNFDLEIFPLLDGQKLQQEGTELKTVLNFQINDK